MLKAYKEGFSRERFFQELVADWEEVFVQVELEGVSAVLEEEITR